MFLGASPGQKSKGNQQKTSLEGQIMFLGRGASLPPQEHSLIVPGPLSPPPAFKILTVQNVLSFTSDLERITFASFETLAVAF